jgi:hypothetical protein
MAGIAILVVLTCSFWIVILLGGAPSRIAWFGFPLTVPIVAAAILVWAVVAMIRTRKVTKIRLAAVVLSLLAMYPATWVFNGFPLAYPASADRSRPGLAVRIPFEGPVRILNGGDRLSENRHITMPEERWAYDIGIDPNPDEFARPRPDAAEYGCWDAPVLSPAAGRVHATHDAEPDKVPGTPIGVAPAPAGNYVDIEVATTGTHLLLAHLRQGSVSVSSGQNVLEGDTLGRCGSSGNTTLPHLHIHHQRGPWVRESQWRLGEGLPLQFRDYVGEENPRGGGSEDSTGYWRYTGSILEHRGR